MHQNESDQRDRGKRPNGEEKNLERTRVDSFEWITDSPSWYHSMRPFGETKGNCTFSAKAKELVLPYLRREERALYDSCQRILVQKLNEG